MTELIGPLVFWFFADLAAVCVALAIVSWISATSSLTSVEAQCDALPTPSSRANIRR